MVSVSASAVSARGTLCYFLISVYGIGVIGAGSKDGESHEECKRGGNQSSGSSKHSLYRPLFYSDIRISMDIIRYFVKYVNRRRGILGIIYIRATGLAMG